MRGGGEGGVVWGGRGGKRWMCRSERGKGRGGEEGGEEYVEGIMREGKADVRGMEGVGEEEEGGMRGV